MDSSSLAELGGLKDKHAALSSDFQLMEETSDPAMMKLYDDMDTVQLAGLFRLGREITKLEDISKKYSEQVKVKEGQPTNTRLPQSMPDNFAELKGVYYAKMQQVAKVRQHMEDCGYRYPNAFKHTITGNQPEVAKTARKRSFNPGKKAEEFVGMSPSLYVPSSKKCKTYGSNSFQFNLSLTPTIGTDKISTAARARHQDITGGSFCSSFHDPPPPSPLTLTFKRCDPTMSYLNLSKPEVGQRYIELLQSLVAKLSQEVKAPNQNQGSSD